MSDTKSVAARGFLSYTRKDNDDYGGVVDQLKRSLEGRFHAATGRQLEIFVDRDAIGWGQDWRARIRESVQSATFFIPVITMRYFESEACREELLAFHEYAKELGVEALILPVVLAGADVISPDDPREDVQMIERLNYKNIEPAWLAGYESPEWAMAIHGMVGALKENLSAAESALSDREGESVAKPPNESGAGLDEAELADVVALSADFEEMAAFLPTVQVAIENFAAAAGALTELKLGAVSPAQRQASLVRVAHDMLPPANGLSSSGAELEQRVLRADARLRAVAEELRSIDVSAAQESLNSLKLGFAGVAELAPMVQQMGQLVQMLRIAALTNVTMRRSLQPAITGIKSLSNAIDTVRSWNQI
ncbi:TIR domain-containing protein [Microbacterium testaceum]|uniref:TIR domain-containing protein n=1 Tax=Microbacterium testaceum TaxID=2033 RepID=UPI0009C126D0|nr:TIR domain-containing protein [Microbacterium testaceum]